MRSVLLVLLLLFAVPLFGATFEAADGTILHYDVIGRGRPVVLLSGGPGFSPAYLEPVARTIGGETTAAVLFHQRGTGRSTMETISVETHLLKTLVADLEGLRQALGIEKLTIVGHSFGGILAMMYASVHPDRVEKLALVSSGGPTLASVAKFVANHAARMTAGEQAAVEQWSDPKRIAENRGRAMLEITRAKTPAYFADRGKAQALVDSMDESSFNDEVFRAITPQMLMGLDLRSGLKKVDAPVLVLHGRQDPLETADEVHAAFAGSTLAVLEDAGHFPWLEQPDAFYDRLLHFLRE